ncbi:hypothetical protein C8J56DRAFT_1083016 [Mycena floridula]|nr:hypothetical protein C8J56DRAFT_1083016 [Mycena floridula]
MESSQSEIAIEGKRTRVASERQHQIDNEVYEAEQRKLLRQEKVLLKKQRELNQNRPTLAKSQARADTAYHQEKGLESKDDNDRSIAAASLSMFGSAATSRGIILTPSFKDDEEQPQYDDDEPHGMGQIEEYTIADEPSFSLNVTFDTDADQDNADQDNDTGRFFTNLQPSSSIPVQPSKPIIIAQFTAGIPPAKGVRLNVRHYAAAERIQIFAALHHFEAYIWATIMEDQVSFLMLDENIFCLISASTHHIRGNDSENIVASNRRWVECLVDPEHNHFLFKDTSEKKMMWRNPALKAAIYKAFFKTKTSYGVRFEDLFSPITHVTMAMVMSLIHFCLIEWSTGIWKSMKISETDLGTEYNCFMAIFKEWYELDKSAVDLYL